MTEHEIERWITVNGARVPIFAGESSQDAVNRHIAHQNANKQESDIVKAKEEADKLNNKKSLEQKILQALDDRNTWMEQYDVDRKAEYDSYMKKAAIQKDDYWKKDYESQADWALHFQKHGYDFLTSWKNVISNAMYGKTYEEWHSAQAGRYKGTGHGSYITTELTKEQIANIDKVFNGLVKQGYLKLSKSGKMATFIKK